MDRQKDKQKAHLRCTVIIYGTLHSLEITSLLGKIENEATLFAYEYPKQLKKPAK